MNKQAVRSAALAALAVVVAGCAVPEPYRPGPSAPPPSQSPGEGARPLPPTPPQTQPGAPRPETPQSQPLPPAPVTPPPPREPTLGAASRSLVGQAHTQMASRNYPMAAASIERALRIEPENPLLWIELAKIRQAEGNSVQAETLARRALRSTAAPKAQAAAWAVIAESYRARGRNTEARQAQSKAETLRGG